MGIIDSAILGVAVATSVVALVVTALLMRMRRELARTRAERDEARTAEAEAIRMLRLSANDLRSSAMLLQGHAGRLTDPGHDTMAHAAAISAATAQVMTLADDLQDHAVGPPSSRVLREETVQLGPLLDEVIMMVTASLGASRRHWRLTPDITACTLLVDRRAMRQILLRVMSNAARFTAHDDWIDLALRREADGLILDVEDEGAGVAKPEAAHAEQERDSRGIGLGLALARSLIEAHGGRLLVEAATRVGTRVSLLLPLYRVL